MGLARSTHVPWRFRRRVSRWTSAFICAWLFLHWAIAESYGSMSGWPSEGRRLGAVPFDDLLISRPYRTSPHRGLVFVHVLAIGYMLLGLNTVCDVYFTGALEVMVEKWHVKPDVAGATFMAAGGSAPELFTSLIDSTITHNDVGFSTIVGSAVFNVLFVIGLCGFSSSSEIKLSWWPLFRDCSYYICGLGLLAWVASDGLVRLWEAIMLFVAYIVYCIIMYNNSKLEALADVEFRVAQRALQQASSSPEKFNSVHPQCSLAPNGHEGGSGKLQAASAWEAPQEMDIPSVVISTLEMPQEGGEVDDTSGSAIRTSTKGSGLSKTSNGSRRSSQLVHGKLRGSFIQGQVQAQRHEERMATLGAHTESSNRTPARSSSLRIPVDDTVDTQSTGHGPVETRSMDVGDGKDEEDEEGSDDEDLMQKPTGTVNLILWYLSLPVYVPLYYTLPKPNERWFLVTFALSLLWIALLAFFMVWWVEILGEVCHIPTVVMGFTLLAAGTSIPDAVSSVAVARAGEGDMAISSSIGSNIFDILVGLPIPWIIKTGIMDGGDGVVNIVSPFLTFYVLLLLSMVLIVILSIHCLGWKLNKMLALMMAVLYAIFLAVAITVEATGPSGLKW